MRKLLVFLAALVPALAFGYSATVTWTDPTTNTDGSAIPATGPGSLASTRVEYGTCVSGAFGTRTGEVIVNQPADTVTIQGFAPASVACFRAFARNTFGAESVASNVTAKTFPTPTPNPPVLGATITVAYDIIRISPTYAKLGRQVGKIALGTECIDGAIRTNKGNFYAVPLDKVALTRTPRSATVVTRCEIVG